VRVQADLETMNQASDLNLPSDRTSLARRTEDSFSSGGVSPGHKRSFGTQAGTRWLLAAALLIAPLFPYAAFVASGLTPFAAFWEFACYRYFGAMSYFEPTILPFWLVQGMPMALLQVAIMWPFLTFDIGHIGTPEQIELFSYASLLVGYFLIGVTLAICAVSRKLLTIDAVALGFAVLALFPITRWYSYFFAPDYWIFELPLAIASTAWGIALLRSTASSSPLPGFRIAAIAGAWIAICFAQKPSLGGIGAFPILFQLIMPIGRVTGKIGRCIVLMGTCLAVHTALLLSLSKFNGTMAGLAVRHYWNWMATSHSVGTTLLSFHDLRTLSGYLLAPLLVGALITISGTLFAILDGERRRATVAGMLLTAVLVGHALVITLRPSPTSVIDLAIYGTCLMPLGLAISGASYRGYVAAAALAIAVIVFPPASFLPPSQPSSSIMAHVTKAAAYVRSLKRPVLVVLHDNRAHPLTIEALALYTGQLPPIVSGSRSVREQFLGDTHILSDPRDPRELVPAIKRGDVIIWGSAPGAPAAETYFPDLRLLTEDKQAVLRTFEIQGGGHAAHIGYLPEPCVMANTAGSLPATGCESSR
jgi:hypothetical protein